MWARNFNLCSVCALFFDVHVRAQNNYHAFPCRRLARDDPKAVLDKVANDETIQLSIVQVAVKGYAKQVAKMLNAQATGCGFARRAGSWKTKRPNEPIPGSLQIGIEMQEGWVKKRDDFLKVHEASLEWDSQTAAVNVSQLFSSVSELEEIIDRVKSQHTVMLADLLSTVRANVNAKRAAETSDMKATAGFAATGMTQTFRAVLAAFNLHDTWDSQTGGYKLYKDSEAVSSCPTALPVSVLSTHIIWTEDAVLAEGVPVGDQSVSLFSH